VKDGPVPIARALEAVIRDLGDGKARNAVLISRTWSKAAGEDSAKHAKPVDIKEGVLIIHVDSSGWLHKLTMDKIRILSQINRDLGEGSVRDIKLKIGEI
jgi:predicted nucleic acid-binding Zn ribbon protein